MEEPKDQDKSKENLICFNPDCPHSKNRFFKTADNHYLQK
jgi:hypothetical protein